MTGSDQTLTVLRETVGTVQKEIVETDAVIDWRRDGSWNTLESLLGITGSTGSVGLSDALQQHAVLACVDVIQRDVSKVDVRLRERLPDGGSRIVEPGEHWLAEMFALDPNHEHTWREFWGMATIHLVLANNVFFAKRINIRGDVQEFIPVIPSRVQIMHNAETLDKYYWVSRGTLFESAMLKGLGDYFTTETMIHVRKRIVDGLNGLPTLYAGAPSIRLAKAINDYQKRLYDNDGQARIAVQQDATMQPLSDDAFMRLKSEIRAAAKKMMSGGEAMLLEPGYKASILAMTAADMRVAEMHDSTINSVARVFGVPPHKIGHIADEKYSNLEVLERTYAHDVLIPIAKCFEDAFERSCLTRRERLRYFVDFDKKAMEIIDFKQRAEALKIGLQNGAVLPDEYRREFGMNPLPNGVGRVRFTQSTMNVLAGDANEILIPAGGQQTSQSQDEDATDDNQPETTDEEGKILPMRRTRGRNNA